MMRNTQVHQIVEGSGQGEFPPHSNHDFDYQYTGRAPHQAVRIGELKLTYDASGNTSVQCRAGLGICAGTASVDVRGLPASHDHWRRFDWTEENWLRQVTDGGGHETRFLYDASGQRVVKFGRGSPSVTIGQFFTVQGGHHATKHVFAGTERVASKLVPVAEQVALWQGGGGPTSLSPLLCATTGAVATGGCRVASLTAAPPSQAHGALRSETYYYHPDHLGSTSWMTDHEGRVHEHVEYYPYGEVWRDSRRDDDPGPQPRTPAYLFTSKEYDPETKLYYFGARYYDPRLVRWSSPDPILLQYFAGKPNGGVFSPINLAVFSYARQSPIRAADPDGRWPTDKHGELTYGILRDLGYSHEVAVRMAMSNMLQDSGTAKALRTSGEGGAFEASFSLVTAMTSSSFWAKQKNDELHATGGKAQEAQALARADMGSAINKLLSGDVQGAQETLGAGTHPVQDVFAHQGISFAKHMALTVLHKLIRVVTLGLVNPHLDPDDVTREGGAPYKAAETATVDYFKKFESGFEAAAKERGMTDAAIKERLDAFKGRTSSPVE
jgi:RHS repeat-associated protein